ncbi:MAG: septum formation protein Maf [Lachnospiraceae bacterium]|nr:septum formation protein Maf [Lachnospiraceae bacterium]
MKIAERISKDFKIILASASPRRKQLLELAGFEFDIWPSDKEEVITKKIPEEICVELSKQKAIDVASSIRTYNDLHKELTTETDILVIGADTIVVKDGSILGKPKDEEDAVSMLMALSGNTHSVYTGVTFVFSGKDGRVGEYSFYEETKVSFYPLDDEDIKSYVGSGDAMDKAGSYGIQTGAATFVRSIEGDYYNVVGLPIARVIHELKRLINN